MPCLYSDEEYSEFMENLEKIKSELMRSDVYGCITGSSLLQEDFSTWDSLPDVDVFVYSDAALVEAVTELQWRFGFTPGKYDHDLDKGEAWKIKKIKREDRFKAKLSTCSLMKDGITVNVSRRKGQENLIDVITHFDMSIIMQGYDIATGQYLDLRGEDKRIATPNPYRFHDGSMYEVAYWVRQFDRVMKYWNRGFDTRPMAKFYIDMIDDVIADGALFKTQKSIDTYESFVEEFSPMREKISMWLDEKKEL